MITISQTRLICIMLLLRPIWASQPEVGQKYDLELPDGNIIRQAEFKGKKDNLDLFTIAAGGAVLQLKEYKLVSGTVAREWLFQAGGSLLLPLTQKQLGFEQGLSADVAAYIPVFAKQNVFWPWLALSGNFTRLSGKNAILSGPGARGGVGFFYSPGGQPGAKAGIMGRHALFATFQAGAVFYELLNTNVNQTYSQNTLVVSAEAGYMYFFSEWGIGCSYRHLYMYDENFPLQHGSVYVAAVYKR